MESEGPGVHKSPLLDSILGCFRTVHTSTSCSLRSIKKPHIHPSAPGTQTSLLVSTFSDSVFMCTPHIPLGMLHMTPFLLPWYEDSMAILGAYHELWISLSRNLLCTFLNYRSKVCIIFSSLFSVTFNLRSSLAMRNQVSCL